MTGIKRIISFGGWAFSTEMPTYNIFRQGVTPENRARFATNVYNFVMEHGLDGVDFDWEYPAAPDIEGIPEGAL
jgi:GH18 family chitinase